VRAVGIVVVDRASEHDPGLGERLELLTVEELAAGGGVEGLDESVLPGRTRVDVEGFDAAQGQTVADGPNNELRALVGADCLYLASFVCCFYSCFSYL